MRERILEGRIACQVLSVEDMSKSRWEQIEAMEALERGEGKKGREIVRVAAVEEDDAGSGPGAGVQRGGGPHKLLLQDAAGRRVYAIELGSVEGVGVGMSIGCKVLLKPGCLVARGVVLLEGGNVQVMGGKCEEMHRKWREGRKGELRREIEEGERSGR